VVYPATVGAFMMGVVPVDSNCRSLGEIFVDACLVARSSDTGPSTGFTSAHANCPGARNSMKKRIQPKITRLT